MVNNIVNREKVVHLVVVTLNRAPQLNALNLDMVQELQRLLLEVGSDSSTNCMLIKGTEKAFCAGGDVKAVVEMCSATPTFAETYFHAEYKLDHTLHTFKKPTIAFCSGITMGGGLGLAMACDVRFVTETTRAAMPEVGIGFYPDVGACYFLSRIPLHFALCLAITGVSLSGADLLACGLADFLVRESELIKIQSRIAQSKLTKQNLKCELRDLFAGDLQPIASSHLLKNENELKKIFLVESYAELHSNLMQAQVSSNPWIRELSLLYQKASPTSCRIVYEQVTRSQGISLANAFEFDNVFAPKFAALPDFMSGVRAKLIVKDKAPRWSLQSPLDVDSKLLEMLFSGTPLQF